MASPQIEFIQDRLSIHFNRFDLPAYLLFLQAKRLPEFDLKFHVEDETYTITAPARFADLLGVERPASNGRELPLAEFLFDDQREIVKLALEAKRFAAWEQCGLGKTIQGLEFGRQVLSRTNGRVLIVTLNEIVPQWIAESKQFYGDKLPLLRLKSRREMREWCVNGSPGLAITNYEKFNPGSIEDQTVNECRNLAGVIIDESNRLAAGGGKQKWALIKSCKGVEYKLSLTATPAPNDLMEFASQASFLEKMRSESDIIWTYFTRDPKTHRWTVKPHARTAFFEFMSSWSIYVNNPKRYGWRQSLPDVPQPEYHTIDVEPTPEQLHHLHLLTADAETGQMSLFADETNAIQRMKLSQVAKGFRYRIGDEAMHSKPKLRFVERIPSNKPAVVAGIVKREAKADSQVLVWTIFDAETTILAKELGDLPGVAVLTGKTKDEDRVRILQEFRDGNIRVLISRASMLGYGMNLQFVDAMVFSGWNDSFVLWYQAVRRAFRFGKKSRLRVYIPMVRQLEGDQWDNIQRKEREFERSIEEMENNYINAMRRQRRAA
jgi:superfamily II DNA or RNA helicase